MSARYNTLDYRLARLIEALRVDQNDPRAGIQAFKACASVIEESGEDFQDSHEELSRCYAELYDALDHSSEIARCAQRQILKAS